MSAPPANAGDADLRRSVVKIYTTFQKPNYYQPWQMNNHESLSGSGAVIAGERILTNAHVVSDRTYIQVRKAGDPDRFPARLEFVAHDSELAVLRVDDPAFWAGVKPIPLGELARQRDPVAAYGFPEGGDDLSITEGVVSRIEVTEYTHSLKHLLTLQTDAAINPGNSGGPVVKGGKLAGVSFQTYAGTELENTGYVIPAPLVRRFLKDVADGRYDQVPDLGAITNALENDASRAYYGVPPGQSGVVVNKVFYDSSAWGVLVEGDVLTAVGGVPVANDGTVRVDDDTRADLSHLISMRQTGEEVALDVVRGRKPLRVTAKLRPWKDLVEGPLYDTRPSYYVFAGMVFSPLTRNFATLWENKDMPTSFKGLMEHQLPSPERRHSVVLAYVLADGVNAGYHEMRGQLVESVNGVPIRSMGDVPAAFEGNKEKFHVVRLDSLSSFGQTLILDAEKARAAHPEIMKRYQVPADRSDDLR